MRAPTPLDQPRALGRAMVSSKQTPRGSVIDGLRQSGSLKLMFPGHRPHLEAIAVNTAGGVTGGDHFELSARAGRGSTLTLSTQAAERAYRAQPGPRGSVLNTLRAEDGATLRWLPQETILFEGASMTRRLTVDLAADARFLMVEPLLFGRQAMGETPRNLSFSDRIVVRRDGMPIYVDGLRLDGDVSAQLDRPAIGAGARAMASLIWAAPEASGALDKVRKSIAPLGGASMLADDLMVMRLLAPDGFDLRRHLVPVLDLLTYNTLPITWRL